MSSAHRPSPKQSDPQVSETGGSKVKVNKVNTEETDLTKLEEEANYFSVGDTVEPDTDICTCHTCIVSIMRLQYLDI